MIRRLQKTVFDVLVVPVEKRKVDEVQELLGSYLAGVDFFRGYTNDKFVNFLH
jgi:hypothetical protein